MVKYEIIDNMNCFALSEAINGAVIDGWCSA